MCYQVFMGYLPPIKLKYFRQLAGNTFSRIPNLVLICYRTSETIEYKVHW